VKKELETGIRLAPTMKSGVPVRFAEEFGAASLLVHDRCGAIAADEAAVKVTSRSGNGRARSAANQKRRARGQQAKRFIQSLSSVPN